MEELLKKKRRLLSKFNSLLSEYRELQQYFIGTKSMKEADLKYYTIKFIESGYESEGLFSLNYRSLFHMINENKRERNNIVSEIKKLKKEIKNIINAKNKNI